MNARHQVSKAAIELIKRFEGYRPAAARLEDGRWTIGYGHTLTAREGAEVSERDAEALLIYDLIGVAHSINEWVFTPLTQNQFDALCAFAFNIGLENFHGSSVLLRINEGAMIQAACAMELWRKVDFEGERIVLDALVRRRAVEKTLFLTPPDGWLPAPSPVMPPKLDVDGAGAVPTEAASILRTALDGDRIVVHRDTPPAPLPAVPAPEDESPVAVSAAAVSARLQAIAADPEPEATPEPEGVESAEPPPVTAPRTVSSVTGRGEVRTARMRVAQPPATPPLVLLALVGLAFFGWALFWAFNAQPAPGVLNPLAVSWVIGVIGIGCFGVAAYLMLERLGGEDDPYENIGN